MYPFPRDHLTGCEPLWGRAVIGVGGCRFNDGVEAVRLDVMDRTGGSAGGVSDGVSPVVPAESVVACPAGDWAAFSGSVCSFRSAPNDGSGEAMTGAAKPLLSSASRLRLSASSSCHDGGGASSSFRSGCPGGSRFSGRLPSDQLVAALEARLLPLGGSASETPTVLSASEDEMNRICSSDSPARGKISKEARTAELGRGDEMRREVVDSHGEVYGEPVLPRPDALDIAERRDVCG